MLQNVILLRRSCLVLTVNRFDSYGCSNFGLMIIILKVSRVIFVKQHAAFK